MQGITKASREMKKSSFIFHKLEKSNKFQLSFQKYACAVYAVVALKSYFLGLQSETILYCIISVLAYCIFKSLEFLKARVFFSQKKEKQNVNFCVPDQGLDSFTQSNRALSVDFAHQVTNRFDDQRPIITDKEGTEAKSSNNCDLKTHKTAYNTLDFVIESTPLIKSITQVSKNEEESGMNFDDILLNNKQETTSIGKAHPGNMQQSDQVKVAIKETMGSLYERMQDKILAPAQKLLQNLQELDKKDKQIRISDYIGILNTLTLISQIVCVRSTLISSTHLIIYPVSLLMIEMIKYTIYTQKYQTYMLVLFNLSFYYQSDSLINDFCLLIHIVACLLLGFRRIKSLEEQETEAFENHHMLQSYKNLIEQIFNTVPDGIGVTDFIGTSINNKIFEELMGDPSNPDQLLQNLKRFKRENSVNQGTSCSLLEDLKIYQKILAQNRNNSLAQESREYFTFQATKAKSISKNQARKYYMIFMSKIVYEGKICLLLTIRDITNQKVIQEKQLIDNMKNKIFKSFTHELMNPLNFLMFSFELISKHMGDLRHNPETFRKFKSVVATAESCTNVLRNIVHDFIDYSILCSSNGGLILNKQEFDLNKFITRVEKIMINQMKSQKVVLRVSRDPNLPQILFSDPQKLEQILLNLLLNAQKFTQKGWIKFKIQKVFRPRKRASNSNLQSRRSSPEVENHGPTHNQQNDIFIRFMVFDTGQGIEKERLQTIFNLFEQNENSIMKETQDQQKKSAGLGLTISQNLCHALGSHIRVKSTLEEGSVFFFDIKNIIEKEQSSNEKNKTDNQNYGTLGGTSGYINAGSSSFNRNEEEKIDENEAVYLQMNQIGKFNMTFEEQTSEQNEEDILIRENSNQKVLVQFKQSQLNTVQENEISDYQSKYSLKTDGNILKKTTMQSNPDEQSDNNERLQFKTKTNTTHDFGKNQSMVQGTPLRSENFNMKSLLRRNQNYSQVYLQNLVSQQKYDYNVQEEENNILQIKLVSKKLRGHSEAPSSQQSSDNGQTYSELMKKQLQNLHQKKYSEIPESKEEDSKNNIYSRSSQIQRAHMKSNQIVQSSRDLQQSNRDQINTGRSFNTIDSMDEHMCVDVIGDYTKLGKNFNLDTKNNYKISKQKLIQAQIGLSYEPKVAITLKNPFTHFEISKELKQSPRSQSQQILKSSFKTPNYMTLQLDKIEQSQNPCITQYESNNASVQNSSGQNTPRISQITQMKSMQSTLKAKNLSDEIQRTTLLDEDSEEEKKERPDNIIKMTLKSRTLKKSNNSPQLINIVIENQDEEQNNLQNLLSGSIHQQRSNNDYENQFAQYSHVYSNFSGANDKQNENNSLNQPNLVDLKNFCCPEILVVDDIDYNRFALVQIISSLFDLDCIEACNGQDCIDQVEEYDKKSCCDGLKLIIMDYEMPILNGYEAAKQLCQRMNSANLKKKIPIVALTAYNDEKEKCLAVGMKRFLTKPAKSEEIKEILLEIQNKTI